MSCHRDRNDSAASAAKSGVRRSSSVWAGLAGWSAVGAGARDSGSTADQPAKPAQTDEERRTPLFAADAAESFRSRWQDIQTSFIDEPTRAVEQADSLVAEIMQQLAKTFADERSHLEEQGEH